MQFFSGKIFLRPLILLLGTLGASASSQCTPAERSVWIGKMEFTAFYQSVSVLALGNAFMVTSALVARFGDLISPLCLGCLGDASECGARFCKWECLFTQSNDQCQRCIKKRCRPDLLICTGAAGVHELPLPPLAKRRASFQTDEIERPSRERFPNSERSGSEPPPELLHHSVDEQLELSNQFVASLVDQEGMLEELQQYVQQVEMGGVTYEEPPLADPRCTADERAIWFNNLAFAKIYHSVSLLALGKAVDTTASLVGHFAAQISELCLSCLGEATGCGSEFCKWDCWLSQSGAKCQLCISSKCRPKLLVCTGATHVDELPLPPGVGPKAASVRRELEETHLDDDDDDHVVSQEVLQELLQSNEESIDTFGIEIDNVGAEIEHEYPDDLLTAHSDDSDDSDDDFEELIIVDKEPSTEWTTSEEDGFLMIDRNDDTV